MDTPPTSTEPINYKYWAFISYSHQDEVWAKWLHHSLETYHVPRSIVGRETVMGKLPRRLFPIFRDRDELPGAAALNDQIEAALRRSRSLIVICSPKSARSKWVNEEIRIFKSLGRTHSVFCLIIDGEPNATDNPESGLLECFPEAVRYRVDAQGIITEDRTEPIAADARPGRDGRSNALLKLMAGLLGVGYDELKQRERRRQTWQRMRLAGSVALMLLLTLLFYTGLCDVGLLLPGAERSRRLLDRYDASVFRPVRSIQSARHDAATQRMILLAQFSKAKMGNWLIRVFNPKPDEDTEVWSHSQALTAIMATPDASNDQLRPYIPCLDAPFSPDQEIEVNGVHYGWLGHPYWCYTQSEPALWTAAALATALARPGLLTGTIRDRYIQHLYYTQNVLKLYHPEAGGGGWATFLRPAKPKYPHEPDAYASVLALTALLATRKAGLPWEGSIRRRDALIVATIQWLDSHFEGPEATPVGSLPGWNHMGAMGARTFDGLTLQIYAVLLQAESEAGVPIPPEILREIQWHLERCSRRGLDYPSDAAEFSSRPFTAHHGHKIVGLEQVTFLWYPWAIACSARWLERAQKYGAPSEDLTTARRCLGHLVVDIGDTAVQKNTTAEWTYLAVEQLYGLSAVPTV